MFSWEIHEFFRSSYCKCFSGDPGLYENPGHYEEPGSYEGPGLFEGTVTP